MERTVYGLLQIAIDKIELGIELNLPHLINKGLFLAKEAQEKLCPKCKGENNYGNE